jgi:ABC-type bacteriocin/lantibiotic exporter with double-glycine peptidase domain
MAILNFVARTFLPTNDFTLVLMLISAVCQTTLLHQYFHICILLGMRIKAAIATAVYRKSLRLSPAARQKSTIGEIVNLMSIDAGVCALVYLTFTNTG